MDLRLKMGMGSNGRVRPSHFSYEPQQWGFLFVCFLLRHPLKATSALCNQRRARSPCGSSECIHMVRCLLPGGHSSEPTNSAVTSVLMAAPRLVSQLQLDVMRQCFTSAWHPAQDTAFFFASSWRVFQHCDVNWCKQASEPKPARGFGGAIHADELLVLFRSRRRFHSVV